MKLLLFVGAFNFFKERNHDSSENWPQCQNWWVHNREASPAKAVDTRCGDHQTYSTGSNKA